MFFVFILSPRTLGSIHSIYFAWMHPGTRHLENKEKIWLCDIQTTHQASFQWFHLSKATTLTKNEYTNKIIN